METPAKYGDLCGTCMEKGHGSENSKWSSTTCVRISNCTLYTYVHTYTPWHICLPKRIWKCKRISLNDVGNEMCWLKVSEAHAQIFPSYLLFPSIVCAFRSQPNLYHADLNPTAGSFEWLTGLKITRRFLTMGQETYTCAKVVLSPQPNYKSRGQCLKPTIYTE